MPKHAIKLILYSSLHKSYTPPSPLHTFPPPIPLSPHVIPSPLSVSPPPSFTHPLFTYSPSPTFSTLYTPPPPSPSSFHSLFSHSLYPLLSPPILLFLFSPCSPPGSHYHCSSIPFLSLISTNDLPLFPFLFPLQHTSASHVINFQDTKLANPLSSSSCLFPLHSR